LPNITAQVDLVGSTPRTNDKGEVDAKLANRPAFASGSINLSISTDSRKLNVSAEPEAKTLEPAGETKINVAVTDKNGEPVANSEVAVVVVDESVLALTGYQLANPMSVFYTARAAGVTDYHSRKDVLLGNPDDVKIPTTITQRQINELPFNGRAAGDLVQMSAGAVAAPRAVMKSEAMRTEADDEAIRIETNIAEINLRENFNALAVFAPSVKTDSNGKAVVPVKLPDNLTRYRVMAVSIDTGKRFGKGESNITAKQPLMVRPSAPRFMNFGDKIELPVVVQNQTDKEIRLMSPFARRTLL
jgi:uncharacterized protein YfaS (alpha-2-macroglobulin family)